MIWGAGGILSRGLGPTRTRHVSSAHMLCTYTGMHAIACMHIGVIRVYVHGMLTCCVRTPACTLACMHIGGQHVNVHGMFTCCVRTPSCTLHSMKHYIFVSVCLFSVPLPDGVVVLLCCRCAHICIYVGTPLSKLTCRTMASVIMPIAMLAQAVLHR